MIDYFVIAIQALVTIEPVPADPMVQSFEAKCGDTHILVQGHGLTRPQDRVPRIVVNGQMANGSAASRLQHDLSRARAVYRLVALCSRGSDNLQLQIYAGEADQEGEVSYWASSATFAPGVLLSYRAFETIDQTSFWFR